MADYDGIKIRAGQVGLFETPIVYGQFRESEALRGELLAAIAERRKHSDTIGRSNVGGWHSDTGMLDWGGAAARFLAERAVAIAKRMSHFEDRTADDFDWPIYMWANVLTPGALNQVHTHPGQIWSAVFYVDMGDGAGGEDTGGELQLEDPRFPMTHMRLNTLRMVGIDGKPQQGETRMKLRDGDLVVFPSWLRHGVMPYRGTGERVSIAMNIDIRPK